MDFLRNVHNKMIAHVGALRQTINFIWPTIEIQNNALDDPTKLASDTETILTRVELY